MEVVISYIYSSTSSKVHVILKLYTDNYYCIVGHLGGGGENFHGCSPSLSQKINLSFVVYT